MQETADRVSGLEVVIRQLTPSDIGLLRAHFRRRARYACSGVLRASIKSLPLRRHLAGIDPEREIILGAVDHEGAVRATVSVRLQEGHALAEIRVVWEPFWHYSELRRQLVREAIAALERRLVA